ncbi:MAG TPA: Dyp-type peroxidase [Candidatus Saccharimonadales bacterium]|nr:Dyp-type peroxidase [Candidatus Saccharimonadales bacterium]
MATETFTPENLQDIQGFGIAGFNKDWQESIFIKLPSATVGKEFLAWLQPQVANAWEVGTFNELFAEIRERTGREPLRATWTAVMISAAGYVALGVTTDDLPAGQSATAFNAGMAARSAQIGDTQQAGDAPSGWLAPFQQSADQVHVAVVVAADDESDLDQQVVEITEKAVDLGCEVVFVELGRTLPPPLTGHEHFGFKDGISQPSITGYGNPAQSDEPPTVSPGAFIFGYPDQSGSVVPVGPNWTDGSFVVFRRLTQDVAGFRNLAAAGVPEASPAPTAAEMGAKLIGRWPSGAPIELFPHGDPGPGNEGSWNDFLFDANEDTNGATCPVWAHIRKANPRDEVPAGGPDDPLGHRMIRRGIPFGPPLPVGVLQDDGIARGLHFFSVVADLDQQFEFVQLNWMNNSSFPTGTPPPSPGPYAPTPGVPATGPDPVVGEYPTDTACIFQEASGTQTFNLNSDLVTVTAGEYFFLPGLAALAAVSGASAG